MLNKNPEDRITAKQALNHPFIKQEQNVILQTIQQQIKSNFNTDDYSFDKINSLCQKVQMLGQHQNIRMIQINCYNKTSTAQQDQQQQFLSMFCKNQLKNSNISVNTTNNNVETLIMGQITSNLLKFFKSSNDDQVNFKQKQDILYKLQSKNFYLDSILINHNINSDKITIKRQLLNNINSLNTFIDVQINIFIINDGLDDLETIIQNINVNNNFQTKICSNLQNALQIFVESNKQISQQNFDLIFINCQINNFFGFKISQQIKTEINIHKYVNSKIIAYFTIEDTLYKEYFKFAQMDYLINKPVFQDIITIFLLDQLVKKRICKKKSDEKNDEIL